MILHSSLLAAAAEAHRHDLLADAERYRTAKAVRAVGAVNAVLRRAVRAPDPPPPREPEKHDEECRYAVSR